MNTFKKELTYLNVVGVDSSVNPPKPKLEPVTKQVSFYELSQTDKSQCRLFFMMRPIYRNVTMIGGSEVVIADPNVLYDLTLHAIEVLMILDDNFTLQDKTEFLNDNFAVLAFGEWFMQMSAPFFLQYLMNYLGSPKIQKEPQTNS
jgi:hypothetical protein